MKANSNPQSYYVQHFYVLYVIPKIPFNESKIKTLDSKAVMEQLNILYSQLIFQNQTFKDTPCTFVGFNRFFDTRIALKLNLGKQLREIVASGISESSEFLHQITSNNLICLNASEGGFINSELDYYDLDECPNSTTSVEELVHLYLFPVCIVSPVSALRKRMLLIKLKDPNTYNEINNKLIETELSKTIQTKISSSGHFVVAIAENEELISSFIRKVIQDCKKNSN